MKLLLSHTLSYSFPSAPSRITSSPDRQTVTEGSNLDVYCNATSKPAPNITWTRVLEDGKNSKVLFVGSPWRIVNIRRNFTGQYCCTADNEIGGPVNHPFPVNVLCEYILYSSYPQSLFFLIYPSQLYLQIRRYVDSLLGYCLNELCLMHAEYVTNTDIYINTEVEILFNCSKRGV